MEEIANRINHIGSTKVYRVSAKHKNKKATHLENNPKEVVKLSYNGGMISADRGELGTWYITERYNLNNQQTIESWKEAKKEFEKRTGEKPPKPVWR